MLDDLNVRHLRARYPKKDRDEVDRIYARLKADRGRYDGISWDEDMLRMPHQGFFRRRGEHAFQLIGFGGERFEDVELYIRHVIDRLPEAYRASIDVKHWAETQRRVARGELTLKDALKSMPRLARVGGACPCANSVRWVVDVAAGGEGSAVHP